MKYQKNYITLIQYRQYRQSGIRYTGYVIGYGYVRSMDKVILPPNQHGYNCLIPNLPPHASHCILIIDYVEERTIETIKQSLKGLFQNGIATYIVQRGDTLSHIALWFEVSVADILAWNPNISNPNMIIDGQKIIIKEKQEELPKPDHAKQPSDIENVVKQPNEKLLDVPKRKENNYKDLSDSRLYPGIRIYQNNDITDSSAVTLPGFGIYIGGGNRGDALNRLMQHEYGHYLDYYNIGFIKFYGMIGIPSLWNAATGIGGDHRYYWTEIRANRLAKEWFGKDLDSNFLKHFPIN